MDPWTQVLSSRSVGPDLRDMTLKYGFNSLLNKMTTVTNLLVIYKHVRHTWMEVTYLNLLKNTDLEITKLLLNLGTNLSVI